MKVLLFDAPADHILIDRGNEIHGGEKFRVGDDRALDLLTQPGLRVSEVPETDLTNLSRADLNQIAANSGVQMPEKLPNKDAVIAAINDPSEPEPEPDSGAGPDDDTDAELDAGDTEPKE